MIENGAIYCLVERESLTEIEAIRFDLTSNNYFILLATGNEVSANKIEYHGTNRVISPKSVSFKADAYETLGTSEDSRLLIILHGSFMSVAWIGLTSIGIITARYFKMLLGDTKVMKKDIWFRIHQLCMMFTLVLTIAAVTLIWVHVGTFRSSWHSIIGMIASALCFWQGFMSIFRPLPTDPARPIFNFMHGSAGKLAHFLAGKNRFHNSYHKI
jgi:Eukaryotic cytochrome b561